MTLMLEGNLNYMAYGLDDNKVERHLMGAETGFVTLPTVKELPLRASPRFGEALKQPILLGDFHSMNGCNVFSERAVTALSLADFGHLFPVELEGRDEKFFWFWSTRIIDCLDNSKTKRLMHIVREPVFFEDRIADAEIFTTPDDQKFQFHLYVTDSFKEKIKKAKLKGFLLRTGATDPKPWKS